MRVELEEDVRMIIENMGLTRFTKIRNYIYPDLVREFFALVELVFKNNKNPTMDEGCLRFNVDYTVYNITIKELCEVYRSIYWSEVNFWNLKIPIAFGIQLWWEC